MNIYIISVRHDHERYVDSLWVAEKNAIERMNDLTSSLQRSGKRVGKDESWNVWLSDAMATDGKLT